MTEHGKELRRLRDGLHDLMVLVDQCIALDDHYDDQRINQRPVLVTVINNGDAS